MIDGNIAGARLLIVDDDPLMRGIAVKTLRHGGFIVGEADGGAQALALFSQSPFDLLLLDVMMPDMDGYEVCRRIRSLPHGGRVPILMLTGLNDTASIDLAYRAGATDFISKPINWTLLSHRVRYSLRASRAVEMALRSRESLERAQRIANMGSWEITGDDRRFEGSVELARVFGMPSDSVDALPAQALLDRVVESDRATVHAMREAVIRDGMPYQITFKIRNFDGALRTLHEQAIPVLDDAGQQFAVEGITQDVTDRVETEKRVSRLTRFDALTGLPNREFFDRLASPALERSRRLGSTCALVHIDIDRFKSVNDGLGHSQGDAVLVTIADRLQTSVRSADLGFSGRMASESVFARVGANAFTLLLVDVGDEHHVSQIADRIQQAVSTPMELRSSELVLTASVGIALFPRDADNAQGLTRCAEQAVYAAKSAGRAQHRFFDEAMNLRASERLTHEADLRRAIADGQLRLHYQPKIDVASGAVVGAEALVRWQHPQNGLVAPGYFIPLAEESGLIQALTDWVLETACADLERWRAQGFGDMQVSVNLSSPSFMGDQLPDQLQALLARHRLPASALTLEVTESILMADGARVVARLVDLRTLGFAVSLDDFGTGYSSLSYLNRFPIDELKIDRAFVTDVWRGGRDGAIAASIIALGRAFGLRVIAEGVETREQAGYLLDLGCVLQQGYLFSPPLPRDGFDALVQAGISTKYKIG